VIGPMRRSGWLSLMDPLRTAVRCLVAYLFLLGLLRLAGKRSIRAGSPFDFVLALTLGDLIDDAIWSEVPVAQFFVASATLVLTKLLMTWRRVPAQGH
jgi:uncharacterized membrane protein YcaP (DUF421 family)